MSDKLENDYASFAEIVKSGKAPVIMQIVPAINSGGVEQGVIDINKAIVKAGGVSIVVSSGGKREPEIRKWGGTHIELPVHSKNPFKMFFTARKLRKAIINNNVDVVHPCSRAPAWIAKLAVKGTKAKFVTSCHAAHKIDNSFKRWYNGSVISGDLIMAISYTLADLLKEEYSFDHDKLRIVQRGIVMENYNPGSVIQERVIKLAKDWRIPEDCHVMILPARVTRIKGHMFLVDALEKLGRKDIFCAIVGRTEGNENYVAELEKYIQDKGMGSQVRMVGTCNDMPAVYMLANIVTCPSLVPEGFGRIPIEAMAMGRPFIGTNLGGYLETVVQDKTGWLVDIGDVDAYAEAIDKAISMTKKEREVFAENAMQHVKNNFTNDIMCEKTLDVYAEVMQKKTEELAVSDNVEQKQAA